VSGAVAGLVAITPAAGFVGPLAAVLIGLAAGVACAFAVNLKFRSGYDDALDVVGIHAVGGITGALLIGVFASQAVNPAGANGLLVGGGLALLAVAAAAAFAFAGSWILFKLVDKFVGLRVSAEDEHSGLDLAQHKEAGYIFDDAGDHPLVEAFQKKPKLKLGVRRQAAGAIKD
jgi:Amt family ammonium transporter